jgi:hypothetical protein
MLTRREVWMKHGVRNAVYSDILSLPSGLRISFHWMFFVRLILLSVSFVSSFVLVRDWNPGVALMIVCFLGWGARYSRESWLRSCTWNDLSWLSLLRRKESTEKRSIFGKNSVLVCSSTSGFASYAHHWSTRPSAQRSVYLCSFRPFIECIVNFSSEESTFTLQNAWKWVGVDCDLWNWTVHKWSVHLLFCADCLRRSSPSSLNVAFLFPFTFQPTPSSTRWHRQGTTTVKAIREWILSVFHLHYSVPQDTKANLYFAPCRVCASTNTWVKCDSLPS